MKKSGRSGMRKKAVPAGAGGFALSDSRLVREADGRLKLRVNGQAVIASFYEFDVTPLALRRTVRNMGRAGTRIFKPTPYELMFWRGPAKYDFRRWDALMTKVLAAAPDGYFMPHISLIPPRWWMEAYPGELVKTDVEPPATFANSFVTPRTPSYGSKLWRHNVGEALESLIEHMAAVDYGRRVIGFNLSFGFASEWIEPAWVSDRWYFGDWNKTMRREFRQFVARDPIGTRESVHVPSRQERFVSDCGTFLDPARGHLSSLWYRFLAQKAAQTLDEFGAVVKRASRGRLLVGALSGYFAQAGRCAYLHADAISTAVGNLLPLQNVDILESPHGYDNRGIEGNCTLRGLPDVLALHGKLFVNQNDHRTHRVKSASERQFGATRTAWESCETVKRNFARVLTRSAGQSMYDFGRGWVDDPAYLRTVKQLNSLAERSLDWPAEQANGLAVVVDDRSLFYQRMANTLIHRMVYQQMNHYFDRIGTAWHVVLLRDLLDGRIKPNHNTWLFLNTFFLTSGERKQLRRAVCGGGRTVVWMYAPGFQSPRGLSTAAMSELVGMNIRLLPVSASGQITLTHFQDPITQGIAEFSPMGLLGARDIDDKESILDPLFYVQDSRAKTLGRLEAVNRPGLAVRRLGSWTSIFAGTSQLNEVILRNICRAAGTHVYADGGDVIYIHPRLIAMASRSSGVRRIELPTPRRVHNALNGQLLYPRTRRIQFEARKGQTHLLELK